MEWNQQKREILDAAGDKFTARPITTDDQARGGGGAPVIALDSKARGFPVALFQGPDVFVNDRANADEKRELLRVAPNVTRALAGHRQAGTRDYADTNLATDSPETSAR